MKTRTLAAYVLHPLFAASLLLGAGAVLAKTMDGMPSRISMNVTVPKQTQGATFGEKVNAGRIDVVLVKDGCVVLFPAAAGYKINTIDQSIKDLPGKQSAAFGKKISQGLQSPGGALAQRASLLGGALPGGAIISAAVSSVGTLAGGAGGGAAAAAYAATGRQTTAAGTVTPVWTLQGRESDPTLELSDGDFELVFVVADNTGSGLKDSLKTQVRIGFSVENGVLKTRHDTVKNSIGNIR